VRQPVPFGKYLLLDRISVGGMAEVFKAKSYGVEGFEKIIAIKRILPTMGEDRDFIKMFIDEAKIAGQLAHANICQIFELGRIDGSHFIAMEYIWGKDLLQIQNRLRKIKQQMPIPMACFGIAKVLEGLDYAHRKRDAHGRPLEIVHRDCSPQNVLVSYEGEVKVIDFGIAKATSRNSRTMAGVLKGKFGYMSPEQARGESLDRRSDLYALGVILWEILAGRPIHGGLGGEALLDIVRSGIVEPPSVYAPDVPPELEEIVLKALSPERNERYATGRELSSAIGRALVKQGEAELIDASALEAALANLTRGTESELPPPPSEGTGEPARTQAAGARPARRPLLTSPGLPPPRPSGRSPRAFSWAGTGSACAASRARIPARCSCWSRTNTNAPARWHGPRR